MTFRLREDTNTLTEKIAQISDLCGISVLQKFDKDLDIYPIAIKEIETKNSINQEEFIKKFDIDVEAFKNLKPKNIWENPIEEMRKTYIFLEKKFENAKKDLERLGIDYNEFLMALIKRLESQLIEAGNGERKLKNEMMLGLSRENNREFECIKTPYFAFAATCINLDAVKIKNKNGKEFSLREIDTILGSKNSAWEFFLPNSLGVALCMTSTDKNGNLVFISQERNNQKVLSQNPHRYVSSASGGVPADIFERGNLYTAINDEIKEELWFSAVKMKQEEFHEKTLRILEEKNHNIFMGISEALTHEIKNKISESKGSWMLSVALVFWKERRNPEIIFIANTDNTIWEIQKSWQNAEDRDESLSIKWITLEEIETDLKGRESWKEPTIDNHFYMSYIGFLLKGQKLQKK